MIDWSKMLNKEYIPPSPYLKVRFENFLNYSENMRTNSQIADIFKKDIEHFNVNKD